MLLLETARDFYHLLKRFYKNENIKKFVNVWLLEDPIQKMETSTCGPFQFYFYENLLLQDKNSDLHSYKNLTNLETETLLNELFTLDQDKNEQIINEYINERQIKMTYPTMTALCQTPILVYLKLVTLNKFSLLKDKGRRAKYFSVKAN